MVDRETVTALRQRRQMLGLGRAEIAERRLLEFEHEGRRQRAIGLEEIQALREIGGMAQRRGGHVAEHADILVAHHQPAQHLDTAQHHHVVDAPNQAAGFGHTDEIVGGDDLILVVAQPRHRLVVAHLALRQRHHRLQIDIEPIFLDGRGGLGGNRNRRRRGIDDRGCDVSCRLASRGGKRRRAVVEIGLAHRGGGRDARGQHVVMAGDGDRELFDQHAEFVDFADHGLDAVGAGGIRRHHPALDGGEPAAEFRHLAGEIGGAARQIRDLAAGIGAIAQPHRYGVVEDQEGQRGQRHNRGFRPADAGHRIQHKAKGGCDQHHADGDENRRNANHVARKSPQGTATLALMLIRWTSVVSTRMEPPVRANRPSRRRGRPAAWGGRPWYRRLSGARFPNSVRPHTTR